MPSVAAASGTQSAAPTKMAQSAQSAKPVHPPAKKGQAAAASTNFLDHFWALAEPAASQRHNAAASLLRHIAQHDETKDQEKELNYIVTRLLRGLLSSRGEARRGFAVALSEVVRVILAPTPSHTPVPRWTLNAFLDLVQRTLTANETNGIRSNDTCLPIARLFAIAAVVRSGAILQANRNTDAAVSVKDMNVMTSLLEGIVKSRPVLVPAVARLWRDLVEACVVAVTTASSAAEAGEASHALTAPFTVALAERGVIIITSAARVNEKGEEAHVLALRLLLPLITGVGTSAADVTGPLAAAAMHPTQFHGHISAPAQGILGLILNPPHLTEGASQGRPFEALLNVLIPLLSKPVTPFGPEGLDALWTHVLLGLGSPFAQAGVNVVQFWEAVVEHLSNPPARSEEAETTHASHFKRPLVKSVVGSLITVLRAAVRLPTNITSAQRIGMVRDAMDALASFASSDASGPENAMFSVKSKDLRAMAELIDEVTATLISSDDVADEELLAWLSFLETDATALFTRIPVASDEAHDGRSSSNNNSDDDEEEENDETMADQTTEPAAATARSLAAQPSYADAAGLAATAINTSIARILRKLSPTTVLPSAMPDASASDSEADSEADDEDEEPLNPLMAWLRTAMAEFPAFSNPDATSGDASDGEDSDSDSDASDSDEEDEASEVIADAEKTDAASEASENDEDDDEDDEDRDALNAQECLARLARMVDVVLYNETATAAEADAEAEADTPVDNTQLVLLLNLAPFLLMVGHSTDHTEIVSDDALSKLDRVLAFGMHLSQSNQAAALTLIPDSPEDDEENDEGDEEREESPAAIEHHFAAALMPLVLQHLAQSVVDSGHTAEHDHDGDCGDCCGADANADADVDDAADQKDDAANDDAASDASDATKGTDSDAMTQLHTMERAYATLMTLRSLAGIPPKLTEDGKLPKETAMAKDIRTYTWFLLQMCLNLFQHGYDEDLQTGLNDASEAVQRIVSAGLAAQAAAHEDDDVSEANSEVDSDMDDADAATSPDPNDVLLDVLIGLFSQPSAHLRRVALATFTTIAPRVTPSGARVLMRAVLNRGEEDDDAAEGADGNADADMDLVMEDEEDASAEAMPQTDEEKRALKQKIRQERLVALGKRLNPATAAAEAEAESASDTESEPAASATEKQDNDDDVMDAEDAKSETSELSDLSDSDMAQFDAKLSEIFRHRRAAARAARDAQQSSIHFRLRLLDFVRVLITAKRAALTTAANATETARSVDTLVGLVVPLLAAARTRADVASAKDANDVQVFAYKAANILRTEIIASVMNQQQALFAGAGAAKMARVDRTRLWSVLTTVRAQYWDASSGFDHKDFIPLATFLLSVLTVSGPAPAGTVVGETDLSQPAGELVAAYLVELMRHEHDAKPKNAKQAKNAERATSAAHSPFAHVLQLAKTFPVPGAQLIDTICATHFAPDATQAASKSSIAKAQALECLAALLSALRKDDAAFAAAVVTRLAPHWPAILRVASVLLGVAADEQNCLMALQKQGRKTVRAAVLSLQQRVRQACVIVKAQSDEGSDAMVTTLTAQADAIGPLLKPVAQPAGGKRAASASVDETQAPPAKRVKA